MRITCIAVFIFLFGALSAHVVFAKTSKKDVSSSVVFFERTLFKGMRGEEVKKLQLLFEKFPDVYSYARKDPVGYFGPGTVQAVRRFQKKYGIKERGRVGPKTRVVLNRISSRLLVQETPAAVVPSQGKSAPPSQERSPDTVVPPPLDSLQKTEVENAYFTYRWRASQELSGEVQLPVAVARPVIVLDGKPTLTLADSAAVRLAQLYRIVLVDDEERWDAFTAGMLFEMVQRLADPQRGLGDAKSWRVGLTNRAISDDVETAPYTAEASVKNIRFSKAAFARSNPTLQPSEEGNSHRVFYSNRLFRAVMQSFFNERAALGEILRKRYGVSVGVGEPSDEFQEFTLAELQYVISVLEDLPSGFRNMPGLEKIVRRKNGLTNPVYPDAPAIAWVDLGYIEFMDIAFLSGNPDYIRRLIAHEVTHFLWRKVLTEETRQAFMDASGWTRTPSATVKEAALTVATDHPKARSAAEREEVWYRKTTTNFVSAYAAALNPEEDFAETLSYYVYQPDWVRTIAPEKYTFIKDVVDGYEYVILVEKQFTFQVFNLEPDVTFPGKIVGVDVSVSKLPNGDNRVLALLHLSQKYGDGAQRAFSRIASPVGTYVDVYFYPVHDDPYLLGAEFTVSKYTAHGYWVPQQITVHDKVDNRRYEGQSQFGWLLFINNPEEDLEAPIADVRLLAGELVEEDSEQVVKVYVPVADKNEEGLGGYATLQQYDANQSAFNYATYDTKTRRLVFTFVIRKYKASGTWTFREFWISDIAGNQRRYDLKENVLTFLVGTKNPDYKKPELDISSIRIKAVPRNPQRPDGETDVTIWYRARDDNSGIGNVNYVLLKPTGGTLFDYHYHDNFYTDYFDGVANEYKTYQIDITLPPGSPPGTWVLQQLVIHDKADNLLSSNFVELGIVRPFEVR